MQQNKILMPALFSVGAVVSIHHIDFGKATRQYGGDWHSFPELFYVEKGNHTVFVDGARFDLCEGQAIIYAPNAYHIGPASTAVVNIIGFETDFAHLGEICNRVITLGDAQKRRFSALMTQGAEQLYMGNGAGGSKGAQVREGVPPLELMRFKNRLELLLIELYADGLQHPARASSNQANLQDEELWRMTGFLREHLHRSLTQEEIAAHCSISVSKLKRLCHEQLGCGAISYFLAMKIGEAKRLICDSTLNFTQIAEHLGFSSIHYFSKLFKEKTGLTPSQYARSVYRK
jgi:AraC-like DNA-binding protein